MSISTRPAQALADVARDAGPLPERRISSMAAGLTGSEILKIAGEIRSLVAAGHSVCDLTVGDFSPKQFPIPARLGEAIRAALDRGETNYPPSTGILELRQAVRRFYASRLGLDYPVESVLIAGGSRQAIYTIYRSLVDPGDRVVYPVPSWNNNHYVRMVGGVEVPVHCGPETRFMPTRDALRDALPGARLLCLNSPLNPAGTVIERDTLLGLCEAILAENEAREGRGERPLSHVRPGADALAPGCSGDGPVRCGGRHQQDLCGDRPQGGLGRGAGGPDQACPRSSGMWARGPPPQQQAATARAPGRRGSARSTGFIAGLGAASTTSAGSGAEPRAFPGRPAMGPSSLAALHPFGGGEARSFDGEDVALPPRGGRVGVVPFRRSTRGEDGWSQALAVGTSSPRCRASPPR
jgi:hypothetical protein